MSTSVVSIQNVFNPHSMLIAVGVRWLPYGPLHFLPPSCRFSASATNLAQPQPCHNGTLQFTSSPVCYTISSFALVIGFVCLSIIHPHFKLMLIISRVF